MISFATLIILIINTKK
nr:hypothetical protein [[Clostridium] colinum]